MKNLRDLLNFGPKKTEKRDKICIFVLHHQYLEEVVEISDYLRGNVWRVKDQKKN